MLPRWALGKFITPLEKELGDKVGKQIFVEPVFYFFASYSFRYFHIHSHLTCKILFGCKDNFLLFVNEEARLK